MKVGDPFNGVTILEIYNQDQVRSKRKYKILRNCCGSTDILSHNRMLIIKRLEHPSICRKCDEKSELRAERRKKYLEQKKKKGQILVPGWGTTLGKMGMRQ